MNDQQPSGSNSPPEAGATPVPSIADSARTGTSTPIGSVPTLSSVNSSDFESPLASRLAPDSPHQADSGCEKQPMAESPVAQAGAAKGVSEVSHQGDKASDAATAHTARGCASDLQSNQCPEQESKAVTDGDVSPTPEGPSQNDTQQLSSGPGRQELVQGTKEPESPGIALTGHSIETQETTSRNNAAKQSQIHEEPETTVTHECRVLDEQVQGPSSSETKEEEQASLSRSRTPVADREISPHAAPIGYLPKQASGGPAQGAELKVFSQSDKQERDAEDLVSQSNTDTRPQDGVGPTQEADTGRQSDAATVEGSIPVGTLKPGSPDSAGKETPGTAAPEEIEQETYKHTTEGTQPPPDQVMDTDLGMSLVEAEPWNRHQTPTVPKSQGATPECPMSQPLGVDIDMPEAPPLSQTASSVSNESQTLPMSHASRSRVEVEHEQAYTPVTTAALQTKAAPLNRLPDPKNAQSLDTPSDMRLAELQAAYRTLERDRDDLLHFRSDYQKLMSEYQRITFKNTEFNESLSELTRKLKETEADRNAHLVSESNANRRMLHQKDEIQDLWRKIFLLEEEKALEKVSNTRKDAQLELFREEAGRANHLERENRRLKQEHEIQTLELSTQKHLVERLLVEKSQKLAGFVGDHVDGLEGEVRALRAQLKEHHEEAIRKEQSFRIEIELKEQVSNIHKIQHDEAMEYIAELENQAAREPELNASTLLPPSPPLARVDQVIQRQNQKLQQELRIRDEELVNSRSKIESLEEQKESLSQELADSHGQLAIITEQMQGGAGPLFTTENLIHNYWKLCDAHNGLATKLEELVAENESLHHEVEALEESNQVSQREQHMSNLQRAKTPETSDVRIFRVDCHELLQESRKSARKLRAERDSYFKRYHEAQLQSLQDRNELVGLKKESQSLAESLQNANIVISQKSDEIGRLQVAHDHWKTQVSSKDQELKQVHGALNEAALRMKTRADDRSSELQTGYSLTSPYPQSQPELLEIKQILRDSKDAFELGLKHHSDAFEDLGASLQKQIATLRAGLHEVQRATKSQGQLGTHPGRRRDVKETSVVIDVQEENIDEPLEAWEVSLEEAAGVIRQLRQELEVAKGNADLQAKTIEVLQGQIERVKDGASEAHRLLQEELDDKENLLLDQVKELQSLQTENIQLENQRDEAAALHEKAKESVNELQENVDSAKAAIRSLEDQLREAETRLATKESEQESLSQEKVRLEARIRDQEAESGRTQGQISSYRDELQIQTAKMEDLEKSIIELTHELESTQAKAKELESRNQALSEDLGMSLERGQHAADSELNKLRTVVAQQGRDLAEKNEEIQRYKDAQLEAEERLRQWKDNAEAQISVPCQPDTTKVEGTSCATSHPVHTGHQQRISELESKLMIAAEEKQRLELDIERLTKRCTALSSMRKKAAAVRPTMRNIDSQTEPIMPQSAEAGVQVELCPVENPDLQRKEAAKSDSVGVQTDEGLWQLENPTLAADALEKTKRAVEIRHGETQTEPGVWLASGSASHTQETKNSTKPERDIMAQVEPVQLSEAAVQTDRESDACAPVEGSGPEQLDATTQTESPLKTGPSVTADIQTDDAETPTSAEDPEKWRKKYVELKEKSHSIVLQFRELEQVERKLRADYEAKVKEAERNKDVVQRSKVFESQIQVLKAKIGQMQAAKAGGIATGTSKSGEVTAQSAPSTTRPPLLTGTSIPRKRPVMETDDPARKRHSTMSMNVNATAFVPSWTPGQQLRPQTEPNLNPPATTFTVSAVGRPSKPPSRATPHTQALAAYRGRGVGRGYRGAPR